MKTALLVCALCTHSVSACAPSDTEVLAYVVALNRSEAEKNVELFLQHVPRDGFWVKYPDLRRELNMTPLVIRAREWKNESGWPEKYALQAITRDGQHVEVTLSITRIVSEEGKRKLVHFEFIDRLVSSNGRAVVTYRKLLKPRSRTIELGAEQGEEADAGDAPE